MKVSSVTSLYGSTAMCGYFSFNRQVPLEIYNRKDEVSYCNIAPIKDKNRWKFFQNIHQYQWSDKGFKFNLLE